MVLCGSLWKEHTAATWAVNTGHKHRLHKGLVASSSRQLRIIVFPPNTERWGHIFYELTHLVFLHPVYHFFKELTHSFYCQRIAFLVIIFKFFHSSVSAATVQTPRCLIPGRKSWSRKQGRHTCGVRKNVFRVLSECPTALSKQMYWISALHCCLVAQHAK